MDHAEHRITLSKNEDDSWLAIGRSEGLKSDSEIAKFLILQYAGGTEQKDRWQAGGTECHQCHTALTLYCTSCHALYPKPPLPEVSPSHGVPLSQALPSQILPSHLTPPPQAPVSRNMPSLLYMQVLPSEISSGDVNDFDKDVDSKLSLLSLIRAHEASSQRDQHRIRKDNACASSQENHWSESEFEGNSANLVEIDVGKLEPIVSVVDCEAQSACNSLLECTRGTVNMPSTVRRRSKRKHCTPRSGQRKTSAKKSVNSYAGTEKKPKKKTGRGSREEYMQAVQKIENGDSDTLEISLTKCKESEKLEAEKASKTHGCSQCHKSYDTLDQLEAHLRCNHGPFVCAKCGKSYEVYVSYDWHVRTTSCRPDNSLECDLCGMAYRQERNLLRHKRKMHSNNSSLKCSKCSFVCPTMRHMRNHIKKHAREQSSSQCEYCGLKMKSKQSMRSHIFLHRGEKPYQCPKCDKAFRSASLRSQHMTGHHAAIERPFRCDQCNKGFVKADNLKYHMYSHTGEKPYQCKICPSAFARNDYLIKHMRTHTGEKPHRCSSCEASFSSPNSLKTHEQKCHSGVSKKHMKESLDPMSLKEQQAQNSKFVILQSDLLLSDGSSFANGPMVLQDGETVYQ